MHCTDVDESGLPHLQRRRGDARARARICTGPARERTETMTSACGVCGSASIDGRPHQQPVCRRRRPASGRPRPSCAGLPEALRPRQPVFDRTGGVHAAGLADRRRASWLVVREDVGRHNAVDKVVGAAARGPGAAPRRHDARRQRPGELRDRAEGERRRHPRRRRGGRTRARWPSSSPRSAASPSWPSPARRASRSTAAATACSTDGGRRGIPASSLNAIGWAAPSGERWEERALVGRDP